MANARTETGLARAKLLASARSTLHPEIWWMVVEELSESHDFDGLFLCARLNRGMAHMALRRLYGIYDLSPACNLQICDLMGDKFEKSACLWQSLVLSSVGETLYPYCCWIKSLKLTSFDRLFADPIGTRRGSRARFLSSHLGKYLSSGKDRDNDHIENFDRLKRDITTEVVDKMINYIKAASDHGDTVSTLYSLQGPWFSSASLMTWAPSLSQLTSLTVGDGTVLNSDVAQAFRENCPALKEVRYYHEYQRTNDLQMAGFLRGLAPNTLGELIDCRGIEVAYVLMLLAESFGVVRESLDYRRSIGIETLKALTEHASSLKRLSFFLSQAALESLVVLSDCVSIESLTLAHKAPTRHFPHGSWGNTLQDHMWRSERILSWLRRCTHLKELEFTEIPDFGIPELLECPEVHLTSLIIKPYFVEAIRKDFCKGLSHQTSLQRLIVKRSYENFMGVYSKRSCSWLRQQAFIDSVCQCTELRVLDMHCYFTHQELTRIAAMLPGLEELTMYTCYVDDAFLEPLASLSRLRILRLKSGTMHPRISLDGLLKFITRLEADPNGRHDRFEFHMIQPGKHRFSNQEVRTLEEEFSKRFRGRFQRRVEPQ